MHLGFGDVSVSIVGFIDTNIYCTPIILKYKAIRCFYHRQNVINRNELLPKAGILQG